MSLLKECLEKLQNHKVLNEQETGKCFSSLQNTFEFTSWGRINWTTVKEVIKLDNQEDMLELFVFIFRNICEDPSIVILWDNGALPGVEIPSKNLSGNIDDITAVSFDTWIFSEKHSLVIEFYHEGEVTLGINK
jgi:hypothetical protein